MVILIVQHNCRHKYKNKMIVLEKALNIKARLVMLQKLCISNWELVYNMFNFYLT